MAVNTFVYVSNAVDGRIGAYAMNRASGALDGIGIYDAGANVMPMAVSPDRRHLYAAVRSAPFRVATFAIGPAGALTPCASAPLPESMCYITADPSGRWLLSASYGGNAAAVSPIDADGIIRAAASQTVATGKHAHAIVCDRTGSSAYVPCLGSDQVMQFAFDAAAGELAALSPPAISLTRGCGPRHMRFSPDNRFAYVLCELTGHIAQLERRGDGSLVLIDTAPAVPPEAGLVPGVPRGPGSNAASDPAPCVWCADLAMTPDGRFLYATERTTSSISCLAIDPVSGAASYRHTAATEAQPRGIRLTPDGRFLVASGELSDHVAIHAVNPVTGVLTLAGRYAGGRGANWVEIVEVP